MYLLKINNIYISTKLNIKVNDYNPLNSICYKYTSHISIYGFAGFAFHVDVATAYKIIRDTFSEREVCELTEIQLYPPQHMVSIVQKGSPLRKMITYG